jgi:hypothetical protein
MRGMTLRQYLETHGLTLHAFAAKVGAHPVTVHEWAAGKAIPRRACMERIEAQTDGAVRPASFYATTQAPVEERAA